MPTAVRPEKGPKYYSVSVLDEVLSVLSGPKPKPSKLSGRDVIKAAYPQILEWRSSGISYEEIADLISSKVPSFKLNVKILRRYMSELETKAGAIDTPVTPQVDTISNIVSETTRPQKRRSGRGRSTGKIPDSNIDTTTTTGNVTTKPTSRTPPELSPRVGESEPEKTPFNELGDL